MGVISALKRVLCATQKDKTISYNTPYYLADISSIGTQSTTYVESLGDICETLQHLATTNQETLDAIEARKNESTGSGYSISIGCELSPKEEDIIGEYIKSDDQNWSINTASVANRIKACLDSWEYQGEELHVPEDGFDGGIDYTLTNVDDVIRLNEQLSETAKQYAKMLKDNPKGRSVLKIYLANIVRVQKCVAILYQLTTDFKDPMTTSANIREGMRLISEGFKKISLDLPQAKLSFSANGFIGTKKLLSGPTVFDYPDNISRKKFLRGHESVVRDAVHFEQYKTLFLVTSGQDSTIKVWDTSNDTLVMTLTGHSGCVYALATYEENDEPRLASASYDKTIILWNMAKNNILYTLKGHGGYVYALATFQRKKSDGKDVMEDFIASGSSDKSIKLWNLSTKKCVKTLRGHNDQVLSLASFRRFETPYLASGSNDKTIKIWNLSTFDQLATFAGHSNYISKLMVYKNDENTCLVSGGWDKQINLWDLDNNTLIGSLRDHEGNIGALTGFIHNGIPCLASGDTMGCVKLWNLKNKVCMKTLKGVSGSVFSLTSFNKETKPFIAFGGKDIELWTEMNDAKKF